LHEKLTAFINGEHRRGLVVSSDQPLMPRKNRFSFFGGHGGQWVGMGRQLAEQEPVFRTVLEECDAAMRPYMDWSLCSICFMVVVILSRVETCGHRSTQHFSRLKSRRLPSGVRGGIEPDVIIGHSMGGDCCCLFPQVILRSR